MAHGDTLSVFEHDGVKHLAQFFALDAKDLGEAADDGTVPVWKHIASVGEYEGHPSGGFKFTEQAFDQIIKNFDDRATPLNIDYEHQTFNRGLKGAIDSAGWIVKLEKRADGDELWALCSLLPDAAELVRGKKIRQCSPVIVPEGTDRKTADDIGFELRSLALTNDPFLDGLHPFQLTRTAAMTDDEQKKADEAAAAAKAEEDGKAKKMADEGGSSADAFIKSLADASGSDADSVLAYLAENQDMLVKAIQDGIEKGGTPAENTNREMRAMTIHIGPVMAPASDKDAKALAIALTHKDGQIKKLSEQLAEATTELSGYAAAKAAAETLAVEAKCKKLQEDGFIQKTDQALQDAIKLHGFDQALFDRTYSMQIPPTGLVGDKVDPVIESGTGGKPLLMSQLDDGQRASFEVLRSIYKKTEKEALEFIARTPSAGHAASN